MKRWIAILLTMAMLLGIACYAENLEIEDAIIIEAEDVEIPVDEVELELEGMEEIEDMPLSEQIDVIDGLLFSEDIISVDTEMSTNDVPRNGVSWNEHSYQLYDIDGITTWQAAKEYCESLGGYLMVVTSSEEQSMLEELLNSGEKNSYWIGGYKDSDDQWNWVNGEKWSYTNWDRRQPDNYKGNENSW